MKNYRNVKKPLWPKAPVYWQEERTLYASVPFSWNMPDVRKKLSNGSALWDQAVIGGPGAYLVQHFYPDYLVGLPAEIGASYPNVLQRINPLATRSTIRCLRRCQFCGVGCGIIEGRGAFAQLANWPDLPIYIDNNIFAADVIHLDRVFDSLERYGWGDFEQGVDARLLTEYHAQRIRRVPGLIVRLALDSMTISESWERAFRLLKNARLSNDRIRSYALIGFDSNPAEAWQRCEWIEAHGVMALPMWFHRLDTLEHNVVTKEQVELGWDDYQRRKIMQWFYKHKKAAAGRINQRQI